MKKTFGRQLFLAVVVVGGGLSIGKGDAVIISRDYVLGMTEAAKGQTEDDQTARLDFLIDEYNLGNSGILALPESPHAFRLDAGPMVPDPELTSDSKAVVTGVGYQASPSPLSQGALLKSLGPRRTLSTPGSTTLGVGMTVPHLAFNLDLGDGYDYLLIQWETADVFYYVGGLTGIVGVSNDVSPNPDCRPHGSVPYVLFNAGPGEPAPVPETGTTGSLIALAMGGLAMVRGFTRGRGRRIH